MSSRTVRDSLHVPRILLALFLLAATVALGATAGLAALEGGAQPAVVTAPGNTTSYLQPAGEGQARQWVGEAGVDVSVAVTSSAQRLHGRFERQVFDRRYFASEEAAERRLVFGNRLEELDRRIDRIHAARAEAIAAHSSGELDTAAFVRTLARVDAAAARAERVSRQLQNRSILAGSPPRSFQTTLRNLDVDLAALRGPAASQLREGMAGRSSGGGTYVRTVGDEGLVLATVVDGEFRRDAYDGLQRQVGGTNNFSSGDGLGIGVAYQRAAELYPWIFRENVAPGPATPYGNTSVYSVTVDHSQGRLSTYLDGTSENVFREVQQKRLRVVPVSDFGSETADGIRVSVNGTHPTGPLQVRVTDPANGAAVDGVVFVDGSRVGTTGEDGRLWTVQPEGAFTVNATAGDESVEIDLP